MMVFMFIMVMMVMLVVVVTALMVMMMLMGILLHILDRKQWAISQGSQYLLTADFLPRSCDYWSLFIVLANNLHSFRQLLLSYILTAAKHYTICMGNLVNKEFTIVTGIHLAFLGMNYRNTAIHNYIIAKDSSYSLFHIRQLAYPRWLNNNPLRMIGIHNLLQGLLKITYQGTADTARVQFLDFYPGFLHKAAINGNFPKFILNKSNFILEAILNQLLN